MKDPRFATLARLLVEHSMQVSPGERVLIEAFDIPVEFTRVLISEISSKGGLPLVSTYHQPVIHALINSATVDQMTLIGELELARMKQMQCYVGIRGSHNISEFSDLPAEKLALYEKYWMHPVHSGVRVPSTKWVVLRWPHSSMAQAAGMSTEQFEDFYFDACAAVDYKLMARSMEPLRELMDYTKTVHITGPGTDLTFSKEGIGAIGCAGERNIPDGEMFTCPVRESVNGTVQYNCDTLYRGTVFSNIKLTFRNGRIEEATAGAATDKLNDILDADEGARYIGEWSLGFNPKVLHPMKDILFDEKIAGSFHLTPGQAYEEADNGNRSQIHWDMVCIQRPEYGGGEIYFDGKLVRKDGLFTLPQLEQLNP